MFMIICNHLQLHCNWLPPDHSTRESTTNLWSWLLISAVLINLTNSFGTGKSFFSTKANVKRGYIFFIEGQHRHFNCPCNPNAIIRLVGFPCQLPLPPDIAQLIGFCSISFVTFKDKIFLTEIAIQISLLASLVKHIPHQPIQISFSSGSVVPNMRLTKKLFHQG